MTDERWNQVIGHVQDTFAVSHHETIDLSEDDGGGTVEVIEFTSPAGRVKLERTSQPMIMGKQTIGSRRAGSQAAVNYLYSDTEKTHQMTAYRWDDATNDWLVLSPEFSDRIF